MTLKFPPKRGKNDKRILLVYDLMVEFSNAKMIKAEICSDFNSVFQSLLVQLLLVDFIENNRLSDFVIRYEA